MVRPWIGPSIETAIGITIIVDITAIAAGIGGRFAVPTGTGSAGAFGGAIGFGFESTNRLRLVLVSASEFIAELWR